MEVGVIYHTEIIKLQVEESIEGMRKTIMQRLLPAFDSIVLESKTKEGDCLQRYSKVFNPDIMDEGCTYEDAYFEGLNYLFAEESLKQEFLNITVPWIFHLFEKQKKLVFGTDKTNEIKLKLAKINIDLNLNNNWQIVNKELRHLANTIKHGLKSDAAQSLAACRPDLIVNEEIRVTKVDVEKYIHALNIFWDDYFKLTIITYQTPELR